MFVCLGDSYGANFNNTLLVSHSKILIYDTEDETIEEVTCKDLVRCNIHVKNLIRSGELLEFMKYNRCLTIHKHGHVVHWGWRYLKVDGKFFQLSMNGDILKVNGVDLLSIVFCNYSIHVRVLLCQIYGSYVLVRFLFSGDGTYGIAVVECVIDLNTYDIAVWRQLRSGRGVRLSILRPLDVAVKSKLDMLFGSDM